MKLTILGKYGPFSVNGGATSSYLVQNDLSCCLLDVGSGSVSRLLSKININDLKFLFLSHLHFDHISDIGVLSYAVSFLKSDKKLKVYYYDDNSDISSYLKTIKAFDLICIKENVVYKEDSFEFSFYKMKHPVVSHGIKIKCNNKVLSYTGDTILNDNLDKLYKGANLVVADGAFLEKDYDNSKPHMSVKQVCNLANYYKTKTIVSHVNYLYTDNDVLNELKDSKYTVLAKENETYEI